MSEDRKPDVLSPESMSSDEAPSVLRAIRVDADATRPEAAPPKKKGAWNGVLIAALKIFGKSGPLFKALKLLKFAKPLVTLVSLSISFLAYGMVYGPAFAAGFLALLFIHEMGHVMALRAKGYSVGGPVFIPFLGAAIFMPAGNMDRDTEAFVGFGGPLIGMAASVAVLLATPFFSGNAQHTLVAISMTGVFLNVFNLVPMSPLDGGRVMQAVGGWTRYVGIAAMLAFTLMAREPGLLLIWILLLDGFNGMKRWLRPTLAAVLAVGMGTLFLLGYGQQVWWIDVIDIALALFFFITYYARDAAQVGVEKDVRPMPALRTRLKWSACYVALVLVAVGAFAWQKAHFTKHAPPTTPPVVMMQ